jgi:hypothetical protein
MALDVAAVVAEAPAGDDTAVIAVLRVEFKSG